MFVAIPVLQGNSLSCILVLVSEMEKVNRAIKTLHICEEKFSLPMEVSINSPIYCKLHTLGRIAIHGRRKLGLPLR